MAMVVRNANMAIVPRKKKQNKNQQLTKAMRQLALKQAANYLPYGKIARDVVYPLGKMAYNKWAEYQSANVGHPGAAAGAIAAPVALTRRIVNRKPQFIASKGMVSVTHRELVTQVFNTTGAIQVNGGITLPDLTSIYHVNPMNSRLFSWLPSIAANFDEYRIDDLSFQYVPSCATTEIGRMIQYWDKDPKDPIPIDRAELGSYGHMSSSSMWAEDWFTVPKDTKWRYCRDSNAANDAQVTDYGQYGYAVHSGGSTNGTGETYVCYTISFREPSPTSELDLHVFGTGAVVSGSEGSFNYAQASATTNSVTINLFGPGSYQLAYQASTVAGVGTFATTGISSISSSVGNGGTNCVAIARVISPGFSVSTVTLNGLTGLGSWNVFVNRCDRRFIVI